MRLSSALDGLGVAYIPEDQVLPHIAAGVSSACWRIGARLFPATTCTTQAGAILRRSYPCLWTFCVTGVPDRRRRISAMP